MADVLKQFALRISTSSVNERLRILADLEPLCEKAGKSKLNNCNQIRKNIHIHRSISLSLKHKCSAASYSNSSNDRTSGNV